VIVGGGAGGLAGPGGGPTSGGGAPRFGPRGSPGPDGPLGPFLLLSTLTAAVVGGLWLLLRRRPRWDRAAVAPIAAGGGEALHDGGGGLALAMAPLGPPPVLLPATIISQVLFDAAELVPEWARHRPAPSTPPAATVEEIVEAADEPVEAMTPTPDPAPVDPKPKSRPRRTKTAGSPTRRTTKRNG
jgi:hypothetical protein